MGLASGYLAALGDPRYQAQEGYQAPQVDGVDLGRPSPARTGTIWGSLFRSLTSYTRFTGGMDQLAEIGNTPHPIHPFVLPYQQGWTRPAVAGPQEFRPKLSAFVNRALGAANAGRTIAAPLLCGPIAPLPVERTFAVPRRRFQDQFPSQPNLPWFNRQPGRVTNWPAAQMTYNPMGPPGAGSANGVTS